MEKLIEELTKVNPSNLSEEGLKLFNKINEIIDRNKELFETCCRYEDTLEHYEYKIFDELDDYIKLDEISKLDKIGIKGKKYISESLIKEKIEEYKKLLMSCNRFSDVDRIKAINERILAYEELLKENN